MSSPRRQPAGNGSTGPADLVLPWVLGTIGLLAGLLWATVQCAALLSGRGPTPLRGADLPGIALALPTHLDDPRQAFPPAVRAHLPGPVGMYAAAVVVGAGVLLAGVFMFRTWRGSHRAGAPGGRREIQDQLSLRAVRARAGQTRPSLTPRTAAANEIGLHLGRDSRTGIEIYGSVEDSYLYLGPPRSGKGVNLVIPQCLAAPGAVIVTATRPDTLHTTLARRRDHGPVAVFDPQHATGVADRLRWSPVHGCADPLTAILRARALTAGSKLSTLRDADFWEGMTQAVVRGLLHAAALEQLPVREVITWVSRPQDPTPVRILRSHPAAALGWADELAAQAAADPRQRDSVWAGVRRAFDCLADPRVLDTCSPTADDAFDPEQFLTGNGTLYLVGSAGAQLSVAPLIAALIEDVVDTARRRAATSVAGRLDPPLLLLLDEAANIAPLPSLPSLLSDGGGCGITTVAVLQSLAQARARWGDAQADAMWDAATIKVVLGGLAHADDLQRISRLAGEIDDLTETVTRGAGGRSVSTSVRRLPALPVDRLRGLPVGRAMVLARRAHPVETVLAPYWSPRPRHRRTSGGPNPAGTTPQGGPGAQSPAP